MTYCDVTMTVCYSNTVQVNKILHANVFDQKCPPIEKLHVTVASTLCSVSVLAQSITRESVRRQ